jgi:hypothetical protein
MTASSSIPSSIGHQANLHEVPPNSPVCAIDFFEARYRLFAESEGIVQQSEIERQIKRPVILRDRFDGLVDIFEQAVYWLIWLGVLLCLALGIFGL